MNTLEIIKKYGLSIRQIPKEVVSLYSMLHRKEGNEIVYHDIDMSNRKYELYKKKLINRQDFIFDDERQRAQRMFTKEVRIPKNPGFWMCKQVNSTNGSVTWNKKEDNLAPTLEDSVKLFLSKTAKQ